MEVILTLSNRFTLAGALPILVAFALAVLIAAIALAPSKPATAESSSGTCDLSPVILDMLLARYDKSPQDCDNLNLNGTLEGTDNVLTVGGNAVPRAEGESVDTWDFSDSGLTEFAISDDDAKLLKILTGGNRTANADGTFPDGEGPVVETGVRFIDLTGNPLSVDDVSFKNIPSNVAVVLTAESNVSGFQLEEYTITEGATGYISAAFPNLRDSDDAFLSAVVSISGDSDKLVNSGVANRDDDIQASDFAIELISFGTDVTANNKKRTIDVNSESDSLIFYWPITVAKDNDNDESWDIVLEIDNAALAEAVDVNATAVGIVNAIDEFDLTNDRTDVQILDADAPSVEVCDRSEDAHDAIIAAVTPAAGNAANPLYGGHTDCDELTLQDLGNIDSTLTVEDSDVGDNEPIEDLIAGDFEGLKGLDVLHIIGARGLPSGIFNGIGSADGNVVQITFANNTSSEDDVDNVGNFKPSTIPAHIFEDQEPQQVIILTDDTDSSEEGTTSGLDAGLYAGIEGEHIFVLTNAATTSYILGNKVDFTQVALGQDNPIQGPTITDRGAGSGNKLSKAARFAVKILPDDSDDDGERNTWLFLFPSATGTNDDVPPTMAANLTDIAVVAVTDDD